MLFNRLDYKFLIIFPILISSVLILLFPKINFLFCFIMISIFFYSLLFLVEYMIEKRKS